MSPEGGALPPLPLTKAKSSSPKCRGDNECFEMQVSVREEDQESYSDRYLSLEKGKLKLRKNKNSSKASRIYKLDEICVS